MATHSTEEPGKLPVRGVAKTWALLSNYHSHSLLLVPFLNTMRNATVSREAL